MSPFPRNPLYCRIVSNKTSVVLVHAGDTLFSRAQRIREAPLTGADWTEVEKCRCNHNRLGFACQVGA